MKLIDNRYELLDVIASGGMATVWRARDTRLDRIVALKRPQPSASIDEPDNRLAREARAAASLNHPNLITVYDFGSDAAGPYLVMEFVEGPTLEELTGRLDADEVTGLGARLADALATIHAAGIVHRDVKPANVIMSERGPLLTDFGIAVDPEATAEILEPGTVIATPSYAAPEVLEGSLPTPASDVYSLAVVIDELIRKSGTRPDAGIDEMLATALATSPGDRPSAAEVAETLGHGAPAINGADGERTTMILETTPTPPAAHTVDQGRDDTRSRSWVLWAAGILALLALGLAGGGMILSGDDATAEAGTTPTTAFATSSTTSTSSTTTSSTTTSSTTTSTSPDSSLETRVLEARDGLEEVLSRPPRSDLNPPEVEDVMKKVDEGIEAAAEGDLDKAGKKLVETERRLEEKLDGEKLAAARDHLAELAELLGVDLEDDDDDD